MKRTFDIGLALLLGVPALFICVFCIIAIRLGSPGPGLFRQTRVGRGQKPFTLYKLRTMTTDTRDAASHEVSAAQITGIGHVLRRTKLDELPQILNVLRGEMSFVGPRPCLPRQHELVAARAALGVFALRPGITGPAQLAGIDMSTPQELAEADAEYLTGQTLAGDLSILWRTATGGGRGDAVKSG